MTPEELRKILRKCWSRETAGDPWGWKPENPAWTQCVPSALVAQDIFGGKIVQGEARIEEMCILEDHFWNKLPDGREIDFTKEQFPESTIITKLKIIKNTEAIRPCLHPRVRKRYAVLRLAIENQIQPNPLFSDEIYSLCFEAAQESECQKMKFGCLVYNNKNLVAATANKIIKPLRHLCKPECIRLKIQSRTESMIGACGHAEEWALQEIFKQKADPALCSFYIAGFEAKTNSPWLKKEAADHSCLRCAVQMYMAGVGKIWVPFTDHWKCLSAEDAVKKSAAYALKKKKI